ncbi:MAG: hypothetical protein MI757_04965, partial [Pirellulales bacterium]|nr:hypothetical protein [Pirellulales bacterium]
TQRLILFVVAAGIVVWVFQKKTLPWLRNRETDLDVALLVEKHQKIDSDLVAAIQFESPEASRWGSQQLEEAVVDYVAEFSKGWNVYDGFTREKFARRTTAVVATLAVIVLLALALPAHVKTFVNRLALGSHHYPTNTHIEHATINQVPLKVEPGGDRMGGKFAYGRPLKFRVLCGGELPETGRIELATTSDLDTEIEMTRVKDVGTDSPPEGKAYYEGELPRMVDSLVCQMYFGDAYTDPLKLIVLPLPVVEATLVGTPPEYARGGKGGNVTRSTAKQFKTLEGSRVDLEVVCKNKNLKAVNLVVDRPTEFDTNVQYKRDDKAIS